MSLSLLLACIWAILATVVALLPMRFQYRPGLLLFLAAPCLMIFIGVEHGAWVAGLACLGFVSMFRHPLRYFWRKFTGQLEADK